MKRNPELEAKIVAAPGDTANYLVYADWLQANGDPRGELIMLQHAGKTEEANAHLERHAEEILGPLRNYATTFDGSEQPAFEWRLGFLRSARFAYDSNAADEVDVPDEDLDVTLEGAVAAVLTHPLAITLEEIVVPMNMLDDGGYFEPVVKAIAEHGAPTLKSLRIGDFTHAGPGSGDNDYEYEVSCIGIGDARGLWKAVPRLERLVLQVGLGSTSASGATDHLGDIVLPNLRHLEVISGGVSQECVASLAAARLPKIEHLDLWFGSSGYGGAGGVEDIERILDGRDFPALRHLGLMNAEFTDALCERLGTARVVRQLDELSLAHGTLSDDGVRTLVASGQAFAHLKKLDLSDNCLSDEGVALARELGPFVITGEQKDDDDDRYVSLSE